MTADEARSVVTDAFSSEGIQVEELLTREYPQETVFVVHVRSGDLTAAAQLGNSLDAQLQERGFTGFVTVRKVADADLRKTTDRKATGVSDDRVPDLIALISARARTSEAQPSLHYVPDAAANLARVQARRHSLIFGRRGAGKTALMLEAKRLLAADGHVTVWLNLQTYRRESAPRTALWIAARIADALASELKHDSRFRSLSDGVAAFRAKTEVLLGEDQVAPSAIHRLVPEMHSIVKRFGEVCGQRLYVFIDDVHYVSRTEQPELLDVLHSFVRDSDAWLKVAMIRHFSKWFQVSPPTGLQAGQDADAIDLDLTLQQPGKAKQFLEAVLAGFARHLGVPSLAGLYAPEALDRLVLASGAVPRDYLVLAGEALSHARGRGKGRLVGKQDVVRAAGDIAQKKLAELDEDAASSAGIAHQMLSGLQILRDYCLDQKKATYFKVDFKEKERLTEEYSLLQSLMDVRLVHLINASVSDTHRSGERSEAYVLDVSQFSGERFKKFLKVLDFERGYILLRETGTQKAPRLGDTPRRLVTILRGAPDFALASLTPAVDSNQP
jgi:hypothetical protein